MYIKVAGIVPDSVVDGPGVRYVIFTQGCFHKCPACHNPDTWDPHGGEEKRIKHIVKDIKKHPYVTGITLSGGDPFLQAEKCADLVKQVKSKYKMSIVTYTGDLYEKLLQSTDKHVQELLRQTDILIDGPFVESKKDLNLPHRGSTNQRIIDVQKSLKNKETILYELNPTSLKKHKF